MKTQGALIFLFIFNFIFLQGQAAQDIDVDKMKALQNQQAIQIADNIHYYELVQVLQNVQLLQIDDQLDLKVLAQEKIKNDLNLKLKQLSQLLKLESWQNVKYLINEIIQQQSEMLSTFGSQRIALDRYEASLKATGNVYSEICHQGISDLDFIKTQLKIDWKNVFYGQLSIELSNSSGARMNVSDNSQKDEKPTTLQTVAGISWPVAQAVHGLGVTAVSSFNPYIIAAALTIAAINEVALNNEKYNNEQIRRQIEILMNSNDNLKVSAYFQQKCEQTSVELLKLIEKQVSINKTQNLDQLKLDLENLEIEADRLIQVMTSDNFQNSENKEKILQNYLLLQIQIQNILFKLKVNQDQDFRIEGRNFVLNNLNLITYRVNFIDELHQAFIDAKFQDIRSIEIFKDTIRKFKKYLLKENFESFVNQRLISLKKNRNAYSNAVEKQKIELILRLASHKISTLNAYRTKTQSLSKKVKK